MANYHVNYLTGSNSTGDGTAGNPWATVAFALTSATSGDTIKVARTGTTQLLTSTAFWSAASTMTTNADLTSQLAVGDFVIISPKYAGHPEFDGWIMNEIRSITSTTIGFGDSGSQFAFRANAQFEIYKFTAFVNAGSSGDYESLTSFGTTKGNIVIEGGYLEDFSAVDGYTNIFRTGLSQNASAGSIFKSNTGTFGGYSEAPMFKNFRFAKFATLSANNFLAPVMCDNLVMYGIGNINNQDGPLYNPTSTSAECTLYVSNCGFNGGNATYIGDNTNTTKRPTMLNKTNLYYSQGQKDFKWNDFTIKNWYAVGCNSSNGAAFGEANLINFKDANVEGATKFVVYSDNSGSFARTCIFNGYRSKFIPTSFTLIYDTVRPQYCLTGFVQRDTMTNFNIIKLPAGSSVDTLGSVGSHFIDRYNSQNFIVSTVIDSDNSIWNAMPDGSFVKTDTVEYSTGTSSKKIRLGTQGYAGLSQNIQLGIATKKNGSQTLQSITIRAKRTGADMTWFLTMDWMYAGGGQTQPQQISTSTVTVNSNTWTDYTLTISNAQTDQSKNKYVSIGDNTPIVFLLRSNNNIASTTTTSNYHWIDSVTFNYA